jgi:hypothetical protein
VPGVEAKEGLRVPNETDMPACIIHQNLLKTKKPETLKSLCSKLCRGGGGARGCTRLHGSRRGWNWASNKCSGQHY